MMRPEPVRTILMPPIVVMPFAVLIVIALRIAVVERSAVDSPRSPMPRKKLGQRRMRVDEASVVEVSRMDRQFASNIRMIAQEFVKPRIIKIRRLLDQSAPDIGPFVEKSDEIR